MNKSRNYILADGWVLLSLVLGVAAFGIALPLMLLLLWSLLLAWCISVMVVVLSHGARFLATTLRQSLRRIPWRKSPTAGITTPPTGSMSTSCPPTTSTTPK